MEALEVGAHVLLLDEDTSATNFMVRDARMQALVAKEREPILPFLDRVRELHLKLGVSTVLVMGGSGDYFDPADNIIRMTAYAPEDVTAEAKRIAAERPTGRAAESERPFTLGRGRCPDPSSIDPSRGRREVKIEARGRDQILFGRETLDLRAVEQLVDPSQTRATGYAMHLVTKRFSDSGSLDAMMDRLETLFDEEGLDVLAPFGRPGEHPGNFARPRRFEVVAGLNRLRSVEMEPAS
jgi:predicted ABC-class ATPase